MSREEEFIPMMKAAERLGISLVAFRRRVRRGEIAVYGSPRDHRLRLVRVDDLNAYQGNTIRLIGGRRGPTAPTAA